MSDAFQTALPAAVQSVKGSAGIRRKPAGTETTERTRGTHRPRRTAAYASLSNHASARLRSASLTPTHRPWRATNVRRRLAPIHAAIE